MFIIAFTVSAFDDIRWFRKHEQKTIFDGIEAQLAFQPNVETRNRKSLRPNQVSEWEVRIDRYRVFYDVNVARSVVEVKMVGQKDGSRLLVRGKEYAL